MSDSTAIRDEARTSVKGGMADLGPFAPPPDFVLPEEFEDPVPRAIPAKLKRGPYWMRDRRGVAAGMMLAAGCFLYARSPFVVELGHYFLPLGYLEWVGLGLAVLSAGVWVVMRLTLRRFVFIRDGVPVVARVLEVTRVLQNVNGVEQLRFSVRYEYRDPASGDLVQSSYLSRVVNSIFNQKKFDLAFGPGDYVTAVVVEGREGSTAAPYALLELSPDEEALLYERRPWRGISTTTVGLVVLALVGMIALLTYGLYFLKFTMPIGPCAPIGYGAIAGAVLGVIVGGLVTGFVGKRASGSRSFSRSGGLIGSIVGALVGVVAVCAINTAFDRSEPEFREVSIVEFWQTTHNHLIRDYSIEYLELRGGQRRKIPARVHEMHAFGIRLGAIEVREGALGMPWVRRIIPAVPVALGDEPTERGVFTTELENEDGETESVAWTVKLRVAEDEYLDLSDRALELAREEIEKRG